MIACLQLLPGNQRKLIEDHLFETNIEFNLMK